MAEAVTGLPVLEFSEAKSHLSDVMSDVVHNHQPRLVSRHRGKESMILLSAQDVDALLRQHRFDVNLIFSEGEVTADLATLGLLGFGTTTDEALADLLAELRDYAQRFFEQTNLYMNTDRRDHLPWLLRFAIHSTRPPTTPARRASVAQLRPVKTPTWREIEEFCRTDGWEHVRSTGHAFFRKILADGTALETHVSFADDKTMSPGRFAAVLRRQLRVSAEEFWETLTTGRPVSRRGVSSESVPPGIPSWVARVLIDDLGLTDEQVAVLDEATARHLVEDFWSRGRSP